MPGAMTSGLIRPSRVGPRLLNGATAPAAGPFPDAPTAIRFFAVANGLVEPGYGPALPAANRTVNPGLFHRNSSVLTAALVYCPNPAFVPQLFVSNQEFRLSAAE